MLLDEIFTVLGDRGPYQVGLYLIIMMVSIPAAWNHLSITFLGAEMDHWCYVPELANLTYDQQKYIAIPLDEDSTYSRCSVYDISYDEYTTTELHAWDRDIMISNATATIHCQAWTYDQSIFHSTAMSKWDLVCTHHYLVAMIQTVYMAGVLCGCLFFGQVSDSVGRLKTVSISSLCWVLCGVVGAFVPNYIAFVVFRFLVGACAAGAFTTVFVMTMEMLGPSFRMEAGIFVQGWFSVGIMTCSGLAYFIRDMTHLQLAICVPPIIFCTYYWFVPESPRWLIAKARDDEAILVLKLMAKINGSKMPAALHLDDNRRQDSADKAIFFDLFKTPNLRVTTIFMWITWLSTSLVYYGLSLGVSMLPGSLFINNFLVGAVEIPAYVFTILVVRRRPLGRRWTTVITFLLTGVFCVAAISCLNKDDAFHQTVLVTLMMVGKMCSSSSFAILYVFAAELFPTPLRNVGVGSGSMMARVGGLLQPQIALLGIVWSPLPFIMYGAFSVVAGLFALYFPETLGKCLPETIEEAENFRKHGRRISEVNSPPLKSYEDAEEDSEA